MLICNTIHVIALAKAALESIEISFVEYTDNVQGLPARSTEEKRNVLNEWKNEKQVLLVDPIGCRGMECKEVIIDSHC